MEDSFSPNNLDPNVEHSVFNIKKVIFYTLGVIAVLIFSYFFLLSAPSNFKEGQIINIDGGMNLRNVSSKLKQSSVIRSRTIFEFFVIIYGGEKHIISSDYLFEKKLPVFEVARRIAKGERHLAPVKVTIPEGFNVPEIADVFSSKLSLFNKTNFTTLASPLEGYLFPDTYFFLTTDNEADAIKIMNNNYIKKITPILPKIISLGKTEKEIITMASIIEKEAKGDTDRGVISGILWRRIALGMPLQVDADLSTYKNKGLPKNPISNPGLEAINAALYPKNSPYLYYLHDKNGVVHYAKNFQEHKTNKLKYLK